MVVVRYVQYLGKDMYLGFHLQLHWVRIHLHLHHHLHSDGVFTALAQVRRILLATNKEP